MISDNQIYPDEYSLHRSRLGPSPNQFDLEDSALRGYWTMTETGRRVISTFETSLPKISFGKLLDLGCSIGITSEEISSLYPNCNVYGIDINPKVIEVAKERVKNGNIEFLVGDGFKKPFPAENFDGIFCMNNLGFTFNPGEPRIFKGHLDNILFMLKKEGYFLFAGGLCTSAILQKFAEGYKIKSLLVGEHENEQHMAKFLLDNYNN